MKASNNHEKSVRNATLAVALITNFIGPFAATSINIAVPHIGVEFHASATSLTWVALSFVFVAALLAIPFGRIADIRGRKPMLKTGLLLVCIAAIFNVFSPNMELFLLFRVLQGAGSAMIFATNIAIVTDMFPAEKRGSVLGIVSAAVYAGAAVGPVVGGFVTHTFGWRGIFIIISALALIGFIAALARLPKEEKPKTEERLNAVSVALFILSLGLLMYGFATMTQNIQSYFILAAGVVSIIVFARRERHTEMPVLETRLFSGNPVFVFSNLATLLNYAAVFAVAYLLSLYLQLILGMSADMSGLLLICQPVIQVILSPIAGRLSDKRSPAEIASLGMTCCAAALFMFAFLGKDTPMPYIVAGLALTGLGIGLFASPNANIIMGAAPRADYSMASAVMSTARTAGQAAGMAVIMIVVNAVVGNAAIEAVAPERIQLALNILFPIFGAICVAGILFSRKRKS